MTRILYLGSRIESYHCLQYLLSNFDNIEIVGIAPHVTSVNVREDQQVEVLAEQHKIPVIARNDISNCEFDLGISLLYDSILKEQEISIPSRGFINFHLGPLPRYRGSNSVLHAIANARKENRWEFEVTLHYIVRKLDAGPVIDSMSMPIFEDDTSSRLHYRASDKIYELFVKNIDKIISSNTLVETVEQIGAEGMYKRDEVDHYIDLNTSGTEIYDKIRSLTFPGKPRPYTIIDNRKIYLTLDEK